jgi:hypothetical protein
VSGSGIWQMHWWARRVFLFFVFCGLRKGGRKKKMTKATYICRSAKKQVVTYFILFLFLFFIDFF